MKSLNISDFVPQAVLYNIAKRVRDEAATIALSKNVPLKSKNEIGIPAAKVTQAQTQVNLTLSPKLMAYEFGSGTHRKKGTRAKYPIQPRTARALSFMGTHKFEGQLIITRLVMHPGVDARPFLEPAKRATRQQNLADMRKTNLANTRLIISSMARKV